MQLRMLWRTQCAFLYPPSHSTQRRSFGMTLRVLRPAHGAHSKSDLRQQGRLKADIEKPVTLKPQGQAVPNDLGLFPGRSSTTMSQGLAVNRTRDFDHAP